MGRRKQRPYARLRTRVDWIYFRDTTLGSLPFLCEPGVGSNGAVQSSILKK